MRVLSVHDVDQMYTQLRQSGGRGGEPLAPATVRRIHAVLRRALQQAVRWGWLTTNPAALATLPKERPAEIVPPSPSDVARLMALVEAGDPDLYCYLRVAASTGARRSQMCGLQWRDVDVDSRSILFARGVVDGPDGVVLKDTKNGRAYRVAIDDALAEVLAEHRERFVKRVAQAGVEVLVSAFVFSYEPDGSKPWRPGRRHDSFRPSAARCGPRARASPRSPPLRRDNVAAAGVPVSTVAGRLGHVRASTTLNVYSHFIAASDQHAADVLGQLSTLRGTSHARVQQSLAIDRTVRHDFDELSLARRAGPATVYAIGSWLAQMLSGMLPYEAMLGAAV